MKTHTFTIIATGVDPLESNFADKLFEAGCDDATLSIQKGVAILDFARQAKSFQHAIGSAISDLESAGAKVLRVEPD